MAEEVGYKREYKIRRAVPGRNYITTAIPYEIIVREAEKRGLTVDEFISQFVVVAEYNNFDGVRYTFKKADSGS